MSTLFLQPASASALADRMQEALPHLSSVYPDHTWEIQSGADSFAACLCPTGRYFGGIRPIRVLVIPESCNNQKPTTYYLELFDKSVCQFEDLRDLIAYIHNTGKAFSSDLVSDRELREMAKLEDGLVGEFGGDVSISAGLNYGDRLSDVLRSP